MKRFFWLSLTFLAVQLLQAQTDLRLDRPYRYYATQEVMARLEKKNPDLLSTRSSVERKVSQERSRISANNKITIPVVFHILHSTSIPAISEAQVMEQLDIVNADFTMSKKTIKHAADTLEKFIDRVAKVDIDFCLAKEDPAGKKASAIRFIQTKQPVWQSDDAMKSAKTDGVDPWNTQQYLNIWVVDLPENMAGYAQMPGGPVETDGIVIASAFFGTGDQLHQQYNQGKTLTHLIGSYLNLYELWNEQILCADDYVEDTPIHNAPNTESPQYKHISTCDGHPVEMTMNFMDNTDDAALTMFTVGQKARMLASFYKDGPRAGLLETKVKCDNNGKLDTPIDLSAKSTNLLESDQIRVHVFPNPTSGDFTLEVETPLTGQLKIVIYSTIGAVVQHLQKNVVPGLQQIPIPSKDWAPGLYLIHTQINDQKDVQRLILSNK